MKRKNVLVLMSDEHAPQAMGCAGHPIVQTPNLDALAAQGVRFTDAYTPSPICVPARASFATGLRVHQTRLWDNAMPYAGSPQGWGHVLQGQGVRVESIGKLHYRAEEDPTGFDKEHLPMHVAGGHGMVWGSIRDPYLPKPPGSKRMIGERIGAGESPYTAYDRSITQTAVEWLRDAAQRREQPFVLYVGLVAPHFPLIAPQEFFSLYPLERMPTPKLQQADLHPWVREYATFHRFEETFEDPREQRVALAAYFGLCSFLDDNIGQVLRELRETGLDQDTTVVYTSDHGDNLGARGVWGKSTLYQESVGVPMLLRSPGLAPGVCGTPVGLLDLYPTILEAAQVDPGTSMAQRPGRSLFATASEPFNAERTVLSEYHAAGSNSGGFMLRKGRWKYHHYVGFRPELFDLKADPEELRDLASEPSCAAVLAEMQATLRAICDPEATDAAAKRDQEALIESFGGRDKAAQLGTRGATPAPAVH